MEKINCSMSKVKFWYYIKLNAPCALFSVVVSAVVVADDVDVVTSSLSSLHLRHSIFGVFN